MLVKPIEDGLQQMLAGPRKIDDKRNNLYRYFVKLLDLNKPYVFVAENVKGILTLGEGEIISAILEDFSDKGYDVYPTLINAADYGVPHRNGTIERTKQDRDLLRMRTLVLYSVSEPVDVR